MTHDDAWKDSTRASGQRGGQLVLQRYGPAFFAAIGRKTPRRERAYYQAIGRVGGAVTAARHDADSREALAGKGGQALLQRRGKEYFRELGRRSQATRRRAT